MLVSQRNTSQVAPTADKVRCVSGHILDLITCSGEPLQCTLYTIQGTWSRNSLVHLGDEFHTLLTTNSSFFSFFEVSFR